MALVIGAYWIALAFQAWHVGLTFDEPAHMLGSYLYWLNKPDLYPQDLPPLIKIIGGWVPRALNIPLFPEMPSWQNAWKQDVASQILDRLSPGQIQELFYLMRLTMTVFPILLLLLIWHWGRLLFGKTAALLLLLVASLSPTALAHGHLVKSDLATAFAYLLVAFRGWRFWLEPSRKNSLLLGLSVLLAMMAKMSMLVMGPLALLLVLARVIRGPRPVRRWLGIAVASVLLIPYAGMVAAYKFDARRLTTEDLAEMRVNEEFPRPILRLATVFRFIPTPVDMQRAVRSLSQYQKYGAPSYMLGEARSSGHWAYYLLAMAIKVPIAIQILFVGGLILLAGKIWDRRTSASDWFLLVPGLLYLVFASQSDLQLGIRLVLPTLPFVLLLGGLTIKQALETRRGQGALLLLLAWLATASAAAYPQGIAYFNRWVGGPSEGWKYLVDSNVDWGQNLPELADYVRRNRLKDVKLYYFGFDKPHRYGLQDQVETKAPPWSKELVTETQLKPPPGIYAVSVTLLPGHFFGYEYRDYFRYFRERDPDGRAGYSIFLYKVK